MARRGSRDRYEASSSRFVGRGRELDLLCRLVEESISGSPRAAIVIGPAGIGKTRLLREVARYATWRGLPFDSSHAFGGERGVRFVSEDSALSETRLADWVLQQRRIDPSACLIIASRLEPRRSLLGGTDMAVIPLTGLGDGDATELLELHAGSSFDRDWAREVVASAHGNPRRLLEAVALRTRRLSFPGRATPS